LSTAVCLVHFNQDSACFPAVLRARSPQRDKTLQTAPSDRLRENYFESGTDIMASHKMLLFGNFFREKSPFSAMFRAVP
jgi:hypothetical protein